ncbi:uncharacterized protein LOC127131854 [Lathyrus oleraceus]|uniref:uncharacterized protein LOC127131854 n=1 Tax=Pisum sativum TaxID=3888 RepID=UPI0021CF6C0B|nr:uncharacterized protein LOC127131854 [Pisum sativum]
MVKNGQEVSLPTTNYVVNIDDIAKVTRSGRVFGPVFPKEVVEDVSIGKKVDVPAVNPVSAPACQSGESGKLKPNDDDESRKHSLKETFHFASKIFIMSQQSNSSSSKNMSDSSSSEPCNPNREDPVADSANTSHARRPKETVSGFSSAIALEERTREGSRYIHNAIATMVTGILYGNHKVLGVSVPLNTIEPDSVAYQENIESLGKNISDDVEQTDAHKESNVDKPLYNVASEEVHVTHDVINNPNCEAETVDLEEFSDNELLSSVVPSIAKRVAVESSLKRKVHGPTKSWSKGVPKKKKTKSVVVESDSDIPCDVPDTLSKKKPTTRKLAASVPKVPIDNISFHFASSVNRWKYVYLKRLALERELAQNVLECKDIMDLIQEVGLMKTMTQFSKCYEMLVKEFIINVSEECVDEKSKEFRKVYV